VSRPESSLVSLSDCIGGFGCREYNRKAAVMNAASDDAIFPMKSLKDGSWVQSEVVENVMSMRIAKSHTSDTRSSLEVDRERAVYLRILHE